VSTNNTNTREKKQIPSNYSTVTSNYCFTWKLHIIILLLPALITHKKYKIITVAIPELFKALKDAKHNATHNITPHCNHITHWVRATNHSVGKKFNMNNYNCVYHSTGLGGNEAEVLELEKSPSDSCEVQQWAPDVSESTLQHNYDQWKIILNIYICTKSLTNKKHMQVMQVRTLGIMYIFLHLNTKYVWLSTNTNITLHHFPVLKLLCEKACSAYGNDAARLSVTCHSDRCADRTAPAKLPFRSVATL
jgi:hypothetical protein